MKFIILIFTLLLTGCVGIPENVKPVSNFELDRYLGKWYEIARMDHSFERGLSNVTAEYSLREDGGVRVINRGYVQELGKWKQAEGKAYFVEGTDQGFLKVSFFGPFYGSYIVFELDKEHYQYAVISGPDKSYMWILSRQPVISQQMREQLVARASALGFDTGKLVFIDQDKASVGLK